MRINLVEPEENRRVRPRRRRRAAFEAAIARPALRPGAQSKARPAGRRKPQPESLARPRVQRPQRRVLVRAPHRASIRMFAAKLVTASLLAVLTGLIVYGSAGAQFFVYSAEISGNHHLKPEDIYATTGVHEQNIFWIRPERVEAEVGRLDGIKSVHVECRLPAQVSVQVEEREPVVMWRVLAQERDWWLDEEGVVLPYHGDVNNTIFVVDSSQRTLDVGDRLEPEGMVASVQQLAASLPGVKVFYYSADRGLSFVQQANGQEWPVYVGTSDDLARKIGILKTLTDYFFGQNIRPRYIDVRWADHPVYGAAQPPAPEDGQEQENGQ